jgi:hypothetical protein
MDFYFRDLEREADFAQRWLILAKKQAFPIQDLTAKFEEERERTEQKKTLKKALKSRMMKSKGGPASYQKLLETAKGSPKKIVESLILLKTFGIDMTTSLEEQMERALKESVHRQDCEEALETMKGAKLFMKTRWKAWKRVVSGKAVEMREEKKKELSTGEVTQAMRESRTKDNKWRAKVQEWMEELTEKKQEQQAKYEKRRREGRGQVEKSSNLEVTVLTNKPTSEEYQWDEFRIEVQPGYQLKEIVQDVRNRWGEVWREEDLETVSLWGREAMRVDGERFILIAQPRVGRPDIEGSPRLGQEDAAVNNFFKATEWRRHNK